MNLKSSISEILEKIQWLNSKLEAGSKYCLGMPGMPIFKTKTQGRL